MLRRRTCYATPPLPLRAYAEGEDNEGAFAPRAPSLRPFPPALGSSRRVLAPIDSGSGPARAVGRWPLSGPVVCGGRVAVCARIRVSGNE